eukprot:UN06369
MNFHQIDLSYVSVRNCNNNTDDGIDDLVENVLRSIDEFTTTKVESTTKKHANSINYYKYKLFSPNPFYPGQSLPIPQSSSIAKPYALQPTLQYIMHKLNAKDDDNDGQLDLQEFSEAIHELETDADDDEIEDIFCSIRCTTQNETSINKFIEHIRCHSTYAHGSTPKELFRGAFTDTFGNHVKHGKIWGSPQVVSPCKSVLH